MNAVNALLDAFIFYFDVKKCTLLPHTILSSNLNDDDYLGVVLMQYAIPSILLLNLLFVFIALYLSEARLPNDSRDELKLGRYEHNKRGPPLIRECVGCHLPRTIKTLPDGIFCLASASGADSADRSCLLFHVSVSCILRSKNKCQMNRTLKSDMFKVLNRSSIRDNAIGDSTVVCVKDSLIYLKTLHCLVCSNVPIVDFFIVIRLYFNFLY